MAALREALHDNDNFVRMYSAYALTRIDADDKDGLPILIEILMGTEDHAIWCVGRIIDDLGEKAKPAVPAILQALKTLKQHPTDQKDVANSLSRIDRGAWARAKRDGLIPDDASGSGPRSGQ